MRAWQSGWVGVWSCMIMSWFSTHSPHYTCHIITRICSIDPFLFPIKSRRWKSHCKDNSEAHFQKFSKSYPTIVLDIITRSGGHRAFTANEKWSLRPTLDRDPGRQTTIYNTPTEVHEETAGWRLGVGCAYCMYMWSASPCNLRLSEWYCSHLHNPSPRQYSFFACAGLKVRNVKRYFLGWGATHLYLRHSTVRVIPGPWW